MGTSESAEFIRINTIPKCFGLSVSTVYRALADGRLTRHKVGGITLIEIAELRALIKGADRQS